MEAVRGRLEVIAYEDVAEREPRPAIVQHICAVNARRGAAIRSNSFPQSPRSEKAS